MVKVLEHTQEVAQSNLAHRARVQTDEPYEADYYADAEVLAFHAAVQAGFHPAGYNLYSPQVEEIGDCLYEVKWESAKSCE